MFKIKIIISVYSDISANGLSIRKFAIILCKIFSVINILIGKIYF